MRTTQLSSALAAAALLAAAPATITAAAAPQQDAPAASRGTTATEADSRIERLKEEAIAGVDDRGVLIQRMIDSLYSFSELGFQEFETQRYITELLAAEGFEIEIGVAGIPSGWIARWGSGRPVIALGSDVDGIPQSSQVPGVAYREPLVEGAPGHGEGHNSGQAVNIAGALAVKAIMERDGIPGTLMIWPGIAEEQLGGKAHYVRAGIFDDVDIVLYSHISSDMTTTWGDSRGNGMVSVEYLFEGESAHGAVDPWSGRSALDAVELMNIGWNFRREHLRIQQRSHYVITDGGDQPNVVPPTASVWYFFRETDYENILRMWRIGDAIAEGAALMTGTTVSSRVLGAAWPQHMNRVVAETMFSNIRRVGMPDWSEADQHFARAVQRLVGVEERGLVTTVAPRLIGAERVPDSQRRGGGSDDIGDVSWVVPTATLRFASNIGGGAWHNWNKGIAMATPIAYKGAAAGAKVQALTLLDFLLRPELVEAAHDYYENVQTRDRQYETFLRPEDEPAIWLNRDIMERFRAQLRELHYDESRYDSYLEQLGVTYPQFERPQD
ncbi:MAG: amidohydrolase [Acidobacteria bacterium]|nr:amidohydrolase [Acidobacteriota bacterium]